ncbi:MAG: tRNA lysidine(34) synthetase TilS [Bdellovibrionales bacterium]
MNQLNPLEFSIFKKVSSFDSKDFLLSVSGGLDSMALLHIFIKMQSRLKFPIRVASVHHGSCSDSTMNIYRDESIKLVREVCSNHSLEFLTNTEKPTSSLKSEEEFRNFRRSFLDSVRSDNEFIVTAHHSNDQLETRIINLLRGTGIDGLVGMKEYGEPYFRPLLKVGKDVLLEYVANNKVPYKNDPSNEDLNFLRNSVRKKLIPLIEEIREGGVVNLSHSLDRIATELVDKKAEYAKLIRKGQILRTDYLSLAPDNRASLLVHFLREMEILSFSSGQIHELIKLLDKNQKKFTFKMLGRNWTVSESTIELH